jgi:hypothetical protein
MIGMCLLLLQRPVLAAVAEGSEVGMMNVTDGRSLEKRSFWVDLSSGQPRSGRDFQSDIRSAICWSHWPLTLLVVTVVASVRRGGLRVWVSGEGYLDRCRDLLGDAELVDHPRDDQPAAMDVERGGVAVVIKVHGGQGGG